MRQDCKALVALLLLRFGPPETIHSISTSFHARMNLESLADYSRVLMQLQNRMERAAASEAESAALVLLIENHQNNRLFKVFGRNPSAKS